MLCVNPRKLPNPAKTGVQDAYIQVSCGKCYACLSNRRQSWLFRLQNESMNSVASFFCSLTIDDDHIRDHEVHKEDLQKLFKKLRHKEDFTYYAIGEYGTTTFRPHYHVCFFFKSFPSDYTVDDFHQLLLSMYDLGMISVSRVTYRRLNYILHYHTRPKEPIKGKFTFQLFSKRLGLDFLTDDVIHYLESTHNTVINDYNGRKYVIPRYYRKKLIEQGYNLDPPSPRVYSSDNWLKRYNKVFDKPAYLIPENTKLNYMQFVQNKDKQKIIKFNNQDKFL